MLIVNLKAYRQAQAEKAKEIAAKCAEASEKTGVEVAVAPSPEDMLRVNGEVKLYSQHVDPVDPGSHTGSLTAEGVSKAGADGTLLNHSENRMERDKLERSIELSKKQGLTTVVCAQTPEECGELSEFNPDFIAFEPPELIGGNTSVSSAKPGMIERAVEASSSPVLTGAGIKDREDVEKSIELGCDGVLVASGVVKAEDIKQEVIDLCQGM